MGQCSSSVTGILLYIYLPGLTMWQFLSPGKSIKWYLPGLTMSQCSSFGTGIVLYLPGLIMC